MAIYQILDDANPVLREKAKPITAVNNAAIRLLNNLRDTLAVTKDGVGLAAPQIGISKRAFVIVVPLLKKGAKPGKKGKEDYECAEYEMINPRIEERDGWVEDRERCLSIPGEEGVVPRSERLVVRYTDREGKENELVCEGYLARVVQHEYDHLDGVLFTDRAVSMITRHESLAADESDGSDDDDHDDDE